MKLLKVLLLRSLIRKADKALYYVKQNGKGDLFFYDQMEKELIAECGTGKDLGMIAKALRESGHHSGTLNLP